MYNLYCACIFPLPSRLGASLSRRFSLWGPFQAGHVFQPSIRGALTTLERDLITTILHAKNEEAVRSAVEKQGVSVPKTWISGNTKVARALKLWKYVSTIEDTYVVYVGTGGEGPVPIRGAAGTQGDVRERLFPREIVLGPVSDADMDALVIELWRWHTGFHVAVTAKALRQCVRGP